MTGIIEEKYIPILEAVICSIGNEYERLYWNKHHKNFSSPLSNSGESYGNNVFMMRAYDFNGNYLPNFKYKTLQVWWYKHIGRGTYAKCDSRFDLDFLSEMYKDCVRSLRRDFNEMEDN